MRKYLSLLILYILFPLYASAGLLPIGNPVGESHTLVGQSFLDHEWIVWLENDSYWLIKPLGKRKQTWSEWWNNQSPVDNEFDDCFYFKLPSWGIGSTIQVYEAETVYFSDYPYLLRNTVTGQLAFAKVVCPNDLRLPKVQFAAKFFDNPIAPSTRIIRSLYQEIQTIMLENSSWYLFQVDKNNATLSEWWNNLNPEQPDNQFLTTHSDWQASDPIQVYSHNWSYSGDASEYVKGCLHNTAYLIENKRNGKLAYALPVEAHGVVDKLSEFANEQYKLGHKNGYDLGYQKGRSSGYSSGYNDGYNNGRNQR